MGLVGVLAFEEVERAAGEVGQDGDDDGGGGVEGKELDAEARGHFESGHWNLLLVGGIGFKGMFWRSMQKIGEGWKRQ